MIAAVHTTLRRIDVAHRPLSDYREIAPHELLDEAARLAEPLAGLRVLQLNATAYGGGVSELLASQVALMNGLGLAVEWRVLCPDEALFAVTKRLHNGMQGRPVELSGDETDVYLDRSAHCATMIGDEWDVVVVHDPQPAALSAFDPAPAARWLWRCHLDTSAADPSILDFLCPLLATYDGAIFTLPEFRLPNLRLRHAAFVAPAIDPLATKNRPLTRFLARSLVAGAGIDLARPLALQVSRFDRWKDPLGVVEAWRLARDRIPGLQLALVGALADDDPEGWEIYELAREATAEEPDCHLLTNLSGIGALEVNAFQREADVAIQKSLREGFGLTVAEALWKETPVVGGNAGGIPLQIGDDEGGILVDSVEACAEAVVALLEDAELADRKRAAGRERVRRDFLLPRLVRDELALYRRLLG